MNYEKMTYYGWNDSINSYTWKEIRQCMNESISEKTYQDIYKDSMAYGYYENNLAVGLYADEKLEYSQFTSELTNFILENDIKD